MNEILSKAELEKFPRPIRGKSIITPKIMHFGPGAFFRSFVASLIDDVNQKGVEKWGIIAVSLNSEDTFKKLASQDLVFNALSMSGGKKKVQQVSSISDFFVAQKDTKSVLEALSDEKIEILSLTITEKGYYYNSDKKELDFDNQNVIDDLGNPENPKTAVGFLVAGLNERYLNNKQPFTILTCDNLPNNGAVVKKIVLDFAQKTNPCLAKWISKQVCFPSSMVDRITPATKDSDIINFANEYGVYDPALVIHEEFFQWVIEDKFCAGRPSWENVGAQFSDNVHGYEDQKIRILNGGHQIVANAAELLGIETIRDAMKNILIRGFLEKVEQTEILPHVSPVPGLTPQDYFKLICGRFANPSIQDTIRRVAFDGSSRHAVFLVPSIKFQLLDQYFDLF